MNFGKNVDSCYEKMYFSLIESIENDYDNRVDGYYERHHVYPKSIFGENDYIIKVTYKEHIMLHCYLFHMYKNSIEKKNYMRMAKAFFSFCMMPDYRSDCVKDLTFGDSLLIMDLLIEARGANKKSSNGELNPFYGKTHSPETISKIQKSRKYQWTEEHHKKYKSYLCTRDKNDIPCSVYHNAKGENTKFSKNQILQGCATNLIKGKFTSEYESLKRSMAAKEFRSKLKEENYKWPSGEDHALCHTIHAYDPASKIRYRFKRHEDIPDGYVLGLFMTDETKIKIGEATRRRLSGKPNDILRDIVNRDPEKIKKTIIKNTGSKRNGEQRLNMSSSRKKFFESGGESPTKGKKRIYDKTKMKYIYVSSELVENFLHDTKNYAKNKE